MEIAAGLIAETLAIVEPPSGVSGIPRRPRIIARTNAAVVVSAATVVNAGWHRRQVGGKRHIQMQVSST
jgi:hypothetical protein